MRNWVKERERAFKSFVTGDTKPFCTISRTKSFCFINKTLQDNVTIKTITVYIINIIDFNPPYSSTPYLSRIPLPPCYPLSSPFSFLHTLLFLLVVALHLPPPPIPSVLLTGRLHSVILKPFTVINTR